MPEYYLGIDVGYSDTGYTTGLCLITLEQGRLMWCCRNTGSRKDRRLADLNELIPEGTTISAVGIDGPLATGFQLINRYRAADALLSRGAFQKRCKLGNTNSPNGQRLHCHATKLAELVLRLEEVSHLQVENATHPDPIHRSRVLEVFPNAFLGVLLRDTLFQRLGQIGRGKKFDRFWEIAVREGTLKHLIRHLDRQVRLDEPLGAITDHDHRAAFICALAGMCVARNRYVSVGDPNDGNICLPPFDVWGRVAAPAQPPEPSRWGRTALGKNWDSLLTNQNLRVSPHHDQARVFYNGEHWGRGRT